jgi:hypothetical protein
MSKRALVAACLGAAGSLLLAGAVAAGAAEASAAARPLVLKRGWIALPGDRGAQTALQLCRDTELFCYVQLPTAAEVAAARQNAARAGLYGVRIFIEEGPFSQLHLADHLADLTLPTGAALQMPEAEALRVRAARSSWAQKGW